MPLKDWGVQDQGTQDLIITLKKWLNDNLSVGEWAGAAEFNQRFFWRRIQLHLFPLELLEWTGFFEQDGVFRCLRCEVEAKWRCGCETGMDVLSGGGGLFSGGGKLKCSCPSQSSYNCWLGRGECLDCPFLVHGVKDGMIDCVGP